MVAKRPFAKGALSFPEADRDVDLLILGVTPAIGREPSSLLRFADKGPFAVLFLVDSKSAARAIEDRESVGCLAKPFSPYELKEKVGQLLARKTVLSKAFSFSPVAQGESTRYLEFPYLSHGAFKLVHRLAVTDLPILVSGEIGDSRSGGSWHALPRGSLRRLGYFERRRGIRLDYSDAEKDILRMEFQIA